MKTRPSSGCTPRTVQKFAGDFAGRQFFGLAVAGERRVAGLGGRDVGEHRVAGAATRATPAGVVKNFDSRPVRLMSSQIMTRRSASAYGSGRISTASTALNIAVLTPMPSASVAMAMAENAGIAPDLAQSVADVPPDLVEPGAATGGSDPFLRLFHPAEMHQRRAPRVGWRARLAHAVRGGHVDERLQLVGHVALGPVPMDDPAHDGRKAMQERHAPSSTLVTANEMRLHRSRCCSSCRLPEAVRR